ncbi:MAG: hypothetical protein MJE68_27850 [Proteobacteria bacterium]|nr:hypothetical protein [Pseudomonadota bacterium]
MFLPVENTRYVFIDEALIVLHKLLWFRKVICLGVKVKFTARKEKQQKIMACVCVGREKERERGVNLREMRIRSRIIRERGPCRRVRKIKFT